MDKHGGRQFTGMHAVILFIKTRDAWRVPTSSSGCLLPQEGWRSLLSCRLFRLARMLLTSLEAVVFSRRASLSLNSSCMQHISCRVSQADAAGCIENE